MTLGDFVAVRRLVQAGRPTFQTLEELMRLGQYSHLTFEVVGPSNEPLRVAMPKGSVYNGFAHLIVRDGTLVFIEVDDPDWEVNPKSIRTHRATEKYAELYDRLLLDQTLFE